LSSRIVIAGPGPGPGDGDRSLSSRAGSKNENSFADAPASTGRGPPPSWTVNRTTIAARSKGGGSQVRHENLYRNWVAFRQAEERARVEVR
jgi:hypothetical protein